MEYHNDLLLAIVCDLRQEVNTLKEEGGRRGKEVIVIKVKHAELTGAEPFVPRFSARYTRLYSEDRVVDGRTFRLYVETNDGRAPDHYGLYFELGNGPVPCKVTWTFELVHHDGQAASLTKWSSEHTYEAYLGWGWSKFVPKARLADAATSPYVKDG